MARNKGNLPFSGSFEVQAAQPFDARMNVALKEDLTNPVTWTALDGSDYVYPGMITVVSGDTEENNGLYRLKQKPITEISNWQKMEGSAAIDAYTKTESDEKYQEKLVSETNIKTINSQSILGSGNIVIEGGNADAVLYTSQTLTDEQQAQARTNIGASNDTIVSSKIAALENTVGEFNSPYTQIKAIRRTTPDVWFDSGVAPTIENFSINAYGTFEGKADNDQDPNSLFAASTAYNNKYLAFHANNSLGPVAFYTAPTADLYDIMYEDPLFTAPSVDIKNYSWDSITVNDTNYFSDGTGVPFDGDYSIYLLAHNRTGTAKFFSTKWAELNRFEIPGKVNLIAVYLNQDVLANPEVPGSTNGTAGELGFWCLLNNCFFGNKGAGTPVGINTDGSIYNPDTRPENVTIADKIVDIDAELIIMDEKLSSIVPPFKERPTNGIVGITVPVNIAIDNCDDQTLASQDIAEYKTDYGVLYLPNTYSGRALPTKLVITCHGYGSYYNSIAPTTIPDSVEDYLGQGWAVMDMNGVPNDNPTGSGNEYSAHYGAPFVLNSYIAGYNWVVDNYNIDRDGVLLVGNSMGGLSSFMIAQSSAIPVAAQAATCPVLDLYKQAWCHTFSNSGIAFQRNKISDYFGFTGTKPTFTNSTTPSEEEKQYFMDNISKWIGFNPIMKNVINLDIDKMYSYVPATETGVDEIEDTNYANLIRTYNIPLKIWHCNNDDVVSYRYSKYMVDSIQNAGGLAHLRTFTTGGHSAWNIGNATALPMLDGTTKSVKASVYEKIMWLKRFV